jgi:hypothetical protein
MTRYLRHFALVMILQERGLSSGQMQSVIGISENLIQQYQALYAELNVPEYQRTLDRLRQTVFHASSTEQQSETPESQDPVPEEGQKGGTQ